MKRIRIGFNVRLLWQSLQITLVAEDATPKRVAEVDQGMALLGLKDGQSWSVNVVGVPLSLSLFRTVA